MIAVSTPESSAQLELDGLMNFLKNKQIPVSTLIVNQVETAPLNALVDPRIEALSQSLQEKFVLLKRNEDSLVETARGRVDAIRSRYPSVELIPIAMNYAQDGFEILRLNSLGLVDLNKLC